MAEIKREYVAASIGGFVARAQVADGAEGGERRVHGVNPLIAIPRASSKQRVDPRLITPRVEGPERYRFNPVRSESTVILPGPGDTLAEKSSWNSRFEEVFSTISLFGTLFIRRSIVPGWLNTQP